MSRIRVICGSWATVGAFACAALLPAAAEASEEFPGALQEAAGMPCTPACVVCHGKTPGDAGSFMNRKLGATLFLINGAVPPHDTAALKAAFAKYAALQENNAAVAALAAGKDPQTGDNLCGPTYGCGAHIAKRPPRSDLSAPLWVVAIVLSGGLLRRRKPRAR